MTFDRAWEAVIGFFATHQISIDTLEKDSGIVVAKRMLTMGSDGDGAVDLGHVTSTRSFLRQRMAPQQYAGSAVASFVRAHGKITSQEAVPDSDQTTQGGVPCRSAVVFNVFVSRFADEKLKTSINVEVSSADSLDLWNGWIWREHLEGQPLVDVQTLISELRTHVPPTKIDPQPVSTGLLEERFLQHLDRELGVDRDDDESPSSGR